MDTTPIQFAAEGIWLKRDDLFEVGGATGGKARAIYHMATTDKGPLSRFGPAVGLATASARNSGQAVIVAHLAAYLGLPARFHMPMGKHTDEMRVIEELGGQLVLHKAGYNSVLQARLRADEDALPGWRCIPMGLQHPEAAACTAAQVRDIPDSVNRIVIPVGSGTSAAGVLRGLRDGGYDLPVLGVRVGMDPSGCLRKLAPFGAMARFCLVEAEQPYTTPVPATIGGVELDPYYEGKCVDYLAPGDLLWVVGKRPNLGGYDAI